MLRPSAWSFRNYESWGGSVLAAGAQIGTLLLSDPGVRRTSIATRRAAFPPPSERVAQAAGSRP
ncbi:MAG: hypothetical protein IPG96_00090 [Proteobacteria bacterium]|nr:hypothetical protein [Pseudomonadota bacterium]